MTVKESLSGNPDMQQAIWNSRSNKYDNVKINFVD